MFSQKYFAKSAGIDQLTDLAMRNSIDSGCSDDTIFDGVWSYFDFIMRVNCLAIHWTGTFNWVGCCKGSFGCYKKK